MMLLCDFTPKGHVGSEWRPVHQAACAAIHRGVTGRGEDITGFGLAPGADNLDDRIRTIVEVSDEIALSRLIARDVMSNGFLPGGWAARWPRLDTAPDASATRRPPPLPEQVKASAQDALDAKAPKGPRV